MIANFISKRESHDFHRVQDTKIQILDMNSETDTLLNGDKV